MKRLMFLVVALTIPSVSGNSNDTTLFNGMYFGTGVGYTGSKYEVKNYDGIMNNNSVQSKTFGGLTGVLMFGSGRAINAHPLYWGGEILVDISETRFKAISQNGKNISAKGSGMVPSFGFRFGYPTDNILIFVKCGIDYTKIRMYANSEKVLTISKLTPIFVVGAEMIVSKKCSCRTDIGYRIKSQKRKNAFESGEGNDKKCDAYVLGSDKNFCAHLCISYFINF